MNSQSTRKRRQAGIRITHLSQGIVIITFDSFAQEVVDQWAAFITNSSKHLGEQHRILYDFRTAGIPSPYALERVGPVLAQVSVPKDTRTAHVYRTPADMHYTDQIIELMPKQVGEVRAFCRFDEALGWLMG
jgi:hypothetical protein